jgi:hypothetical protein
MDDEVNKSKFETTGIKLPEALRGLIDDPPLLDGEDPELYSSLVTAVIEEEKPQSIMDFIDAIDQVNKVLGRGTPQARVRRTNSRRNAQGIGVFLAAYKGDEECCSSGSQIFQQKPEGKKGDYIALGPVWNYGDGDPG